MSDRLCRPCDASRPTGMRFAAAPPAFLAGSPGHIPGRRPSRRHALRDCKVHIPLLYMVLKFLVFCKRPTLATTMLDGVSLLPADSAAYIAAFIIHELPGREQREGKQQHRETLCSVHPGYYGTAVQLDTRPSGIQA